MPPLLDAAGRPTPATTFLLVHRALRRDLARFGPALRAARGDAEQRARVVGHWRDVEAALDAHHAQEDAALFPALLEAEPSLAPVLAQLDSQHAALDAALAGLRTAFEAGDDTAAADALDELANDLDGHLALEEEHLVPVMLAGAGVLRGPGRRDAGPDPRWLAAWAAEGLDARTSAAVAATLPAEAAARLAGDSAAYGARTAQVWRDVPGGGVGASSPPTTESSSASSAELGLEGSGAPGNDEPGQHSGRRAGDEDGRGSGRDAVPQPGRQGAGAGHR